MGGAISEVTAMTKNLQTYLLERINEIRQRARVSSDFLKTMRRKISQMKFAIGFPWGIEDEGDLNDFYRSYPNSSSRFFATWISAAKLKKQHELVDQSDVMFDITSINAFYSGTRNQVIIPASIMQPPFFYANGIPAYNYGRLGTVSIISFPSRLVI